ncbi:hypothetical protein HKCCE2091_11195 [Rhodobacterales bacterium HKCCE2091]|nr:hypothetical protein [Rhodobacterales bacterium HKCCE2091]
MHLFRRDNRGRTEATKVIWARYEILYTAVDFGAALCFITGSILFFSEDLQTPGTWLFLVGSILFAAKPTIRFVREIHLYRMGYLDDLAKRADL